MVITGHAQIMMTRALTMKHALRLEVRSGLKVSNKFNVYQIVKEEFGFKGSKKKSIRAARSVHRREARKNLCTARGRKASQRVRKCLKGWVSVVPPRVATGRPPRCDRPAPQTQCMSIHMVSLKVFLTVWNWARVETRNLINTLIH